MHAGARLPGATLAVALPDGRVIAFATGWADTLRREPMTTSARLLAGSVGKIGVAAVAMQLAGAGSLGPDDPVSRWLRT